MSHEVMFQSMVEVISEGVVGPTKVEYRKAARDELK